MVLRRFSMQVIGRVLLISSTVVLFFYLMTQTALYVTLILIGLALIYQVFSLIQLIQRTNRDIARFLDTIKFADFSQTFSSTGKGSSFDELYASFSKVTDAFQQTRAEKEANHRYLQTVVHHVGVGLLCFREKGKVELINTAAKRLLNVPHLRHIGDLHKISPALAVAFQNLTPRERVLVKAEIGREPVQLAIYSTTFKLQEAQYTLVSIQNISHELEEREMDAWQNLTRVLAHEIMNSITPIASLSGTVNELLQPAPKNGQLIEPETLEDVRTALQTINKRSEGLLHFVSAYRDLTRIPQPQFQRCHVQELTTRVHRLLHPRAEELGLTFTTEVHPTTLQLQADPELIEQVLINLVKNAIEAVENQANGKIILSGLLDERGKVLIQVSDNGPGLSADVQDRIFVPFFTTKSDGSGIGLSFSRRIMRMHEGTISVHSAPHQQTTFTLRF